MSEELKPCPFCGGDKVFHREDYNGVYVECYENQDGCGAETPYFDTTEEATAFWNRRADSPDLATLQRKADALDAVMEQLKDILLSDMGDEVRMFAREMLGEIAAALEDACTTPK